MISANNTALYVPYLETMVLLSCPCIIIYSYTKCNNFYVTKAKFLKFKKEQRLINGTEREKEQFTAFTQLDTCTYCQYTIVPQFYPFGLTHGDTELFSESEGYSPLVYLSRDMYFNEEALREVYVSAFKGC